MNPTMKIMSEQAIFVSFGDIIDEQIHTQIQRAIALVEAAQIDGIIEIVSGYTNFCVYYEPLRMKKNVAHLDGNSIAEKTITLLQHILKEEQHHAEENGRLIEIPVRYGGQYGPDLAEVAAYHNMSESEVVQRHTSVDYLVYMLGFAPGFPFLGGLDKAIATPRKQTPRLKIEAGAVGIAGEQTGVYPLATPGGWQIIGQTDMALFLPNETAPTLLRAGDRVRFVAVEGDAQ